MPEFVKFEAGTTQEAMKLVKAKLGPDALILGIEPKVIRQGFMGYRKKRVFEITASPGSVARAARKTVSNPPAVPGLTVPKALSAAYASSSPAGGESQPRLPAKSRTYIPDFHETSDSLAMKGLRGEITQVKEMISSLVAGQRAGNIIDLPQPLQDIFFHLKATGLTERSAIKIVRELNALLTADEIDDSGALSKALQTAIGRRFATAEEMFETGKTRKIALVGPTGVGKTTTIAKLATDYQFKKYKRCALVTQDTIRLGAVEQLRLCANIINCPLSHVDTPNQMRAAVREHSSRDLILIDTAGRSPFNPLQMNDLRGTLEAAQPDEVHLVLSMTSTIDALKSVVERFKIYKVDRLILTKLDEVEKWGMAIDVAETFALPFSFITFGQDMANDISRAKSSKLAQIALGEDIPWAGQLVGGCRT